jgi:hypothetical protein
VPVETSGPEAGAVAKAEGVPGGGVAAAVETVAGAALLAAEGAGFKLSWVLLWQPIAPPSKPPANPSEVSARNCLRDLDLAFFTRPPISAFYP